MPKGPKKTTAKVSPARIALLLVKIILVWIGNLPFLSLRAISVAIFHNSRLLALRSRPRRSFHSLLAMTKHHQGRGRPKKFRLSRKSKILLAIGSSVVFLFIYTITLLTAAYQLPSPTKLISPDEPVTTQIYDRNGKLLYMLYEGKNRTLTKLSGVPNSLIQATLAAEDRNFYSHIGIDPVAIARALYQNYKYGTMEGASTLTQQLIKNSLLTPEKSYIRKAKEIVLAIWAERIYSKDQILQMYFNEAPYGGSVVGVAAAAQAYFDKEPRDLTLAESAYLAGLPVSPTQFSPYGSEPELGKLRQKEVLQRMVKAGYIKQNQADEAFAQNLDIKPLVNDIHAPHFVFYIRDLLAQKYGPRVVAQGGLKVITSLDLDLQEQAEKIVAAEVGKLRPLNVQNGAAMILDARTGQILAMVGSRDYHYPNFGNYNVTLSLRQPGSSIKPATYATAFAKGFSPGNIILDTPVSFKDEWGNAYTPVNYDGKFHGPVTLRQALGSSLNIPAVKLLAQVGVEQMAQTAESLGITTFANPKRFGLSLTLGGADVKMVEMMGMYDAFARSGKASAPTGILQVTDYKGNVLEEYKDLGYQAIAPEIAYLVTNILSDDKARSLAFGTNSLLNIPGFAVAVKTGTSDSKRDNWTFGYTPKYVVGVWVGNPDNSPMDPNLASGITGAAPIWNKIMHTLLDNTEPLAFNRPAGVVEIMVDGRKDLGIAGNLPKAMVRMQKVEDKLVFSDAFSEYSTPSAQAALKEKVVN